LHPTKGRIRLEIEIEIGLEFNQSEERKSISSLVNFVLIDQNPIQSQSQSLVRYGLKARITLEIEIKIRLEFNQSEERKPVSGLVNFVLIGQNPIQSQS